MVPPQAAMSPPPPELTLAPKKITQNVYFSQTCFGVPCCTVAGNKNWKHYGILKNTTLIKQANKNVCYTHLNVNLFSFMLLSTDILSWNLWAFIDNEWAFKLNMIQPDFSYDYLALYCFVIWLYDGFVYVNSNKETGSQWKLLISIKCVGDKMRRVPLNSRWLKMGGKVWKSCLYYIFLIILIIIYVAEPLRRVIHK